MSVGQQRLPLAPGDRDAKRPTTAHGLEAAARALGNTPAIVARHYLAADTTTDIDHTGLSQTAAPKIRRAEYAARGWKITCGGLTAGG